MAREPGTLSDFEDAAQEEWDALVADYLESGPQSPHLLALPDDERTPADVTVDWGAYPVRVEACLGSRRNADRMLDWVGPQGQIGRAKYQEEYAEWRVVTDAAGAIRRFELTTEFPEYWLTLAAHHPLKVVELVRRFSGDETVSAAALYGGVDPFDLSPDERRNAFEDAMLPRGGRAPWSPYNNGEKAICFMSQGANTLGALIGLVKAAAFPYVEEGSNEPLNGSQAIATGDLGGAAVACRNSDPTAVGATVGLAVQGRLFALDDPVGVYIQSVDNAALAQPDGSDVPLEWFQFQRGSRPPESKERSQRLVLEVPPEAGFTISELVENETGENIRYGGQIAALVQLGVYARVSTDGQRPVEPELRPHAVPEIVPCDQHPDCEGIRADFQQFEQLGTNLLDETPTEVARTRGRRGW
jgi:hypothetical protein